MKAGETLVFEVRAQRFGSPVDSLVRIVDTLGNQVAANDDYNFPGSHFSKDSYLSHEFKEGGRYFVEIRNLWKTTGEDFPYQLLVHPPQPRFELELEFGQPLPLRRRAGLGNGESAAARRLQGSGTRRGERTSHQASPPIRSKFPRTRTKAISSRRSGGREAGDLRQCSGHGRRHGQARLAVGPDLERRRRRRDVRNRGPGHPGGDRKPEVFARGRGRDRHVVRGGTAEFQVSISRAEGFSEPIHFFFENLPPGVTAREARPRPPRLRMLQSD